MGNKGATGPFAPLVVQARNVIGKKRFNKLRGKAISLHSQGTQCLMFAPSALLQGSGSSGMQLLCSKARFQLPPGMTTPVQC